MVGTNREGHGGLAGRLIVGYAELINNKFGYISRMISNITSSVSRIMEGGKAGYRFTATGTFDRLLTGFKVINDGGGGDPLPDLFCHTIRVPLRSVRAGDSTVVTRHASP